MKGQSNRLGPLFLAQGVKRSHLMTYLVVAFFSTCMMAFINFVQPYLLTEFLKIPEAEQGQAVGNLVFWNELVIIFSIGLIGALSDRWGRSVIYAAGFFVMAAVYTLFPLAESLTELTFMRVFFALGAAAVTAMLGTVMADYPTNDTRGKLTGAVGVMTGLGIMLIVMVLSKLPYWYQDAARDAAQAGQWSFWTVAGLCILVGILALSGLQKGIPIRHEQKPPVKKLVREGLVAARNPKIALAYASSFVSRGDLAIVGTFLSLWVVQESMAKGMGSADALKTAGMIFGISQGAALLWAPVIGIICDRVNRVSAMSMALMLACLGYCSLGFVEDAGSVGMILGCVLVGIGEISGVIASQALIGEQAPEEFRGSVIGGFGFFGALGILLATKAGGYLFDHVHPSAPFVAIGLVNGVVFLLALATLWSSQERGRLPLSSSQAFGTQK